MKFLIQIPQLIYAGAEKVLVSFANDLVSRGHEVEILESYDRGYLKPQFDARVRFHCICSKEYTRKHYASLAEIRETKSLPKKLTKCGRLAFSKVVGYRRFAEKLAARHYADKQYDVAINYLEIESPNFLLRAVHAKKYLQWIHIDVGNMKEPEQMDLLVPAFEKTDAIICVAETARQSFISRYPQFTDRTHVIYNFFDVGLIREKAEEPFAYSAAKADVPILLSVGRMTSQKSYLRFLNVLVRLREEHLQFQWYVLGDGQEREAIEHRIKELHLEEYVFLEGLTDNPYKYMKRCDLFVLPSAWEGFPTVTVEAKILNCAVLATDVSGIREQLVHGETGWIVENTEQAIYESLKYLLECPQILKKIKSNQGMEHIWSSEEKYRELMEIVKPCCER
jgi:glycosyltransferase involved in cell wall biosynthesis